MRSCKERKNFNRYLEILFAVTSIIQDRNAGTLISGTFARAKCKQRSPIGKKIWTLYPSGYPSLCGKSCDAFAQSAFFLEGVTWRRSRGRVCSLQFTLERQEGLPAVLYPLQGFWSLNIVQPIVKSKSLRLNEKKNITARNNKRFAKIRIPGNLKLQLSLTANWKLHFAVSYEAPNAKVLYWLQLPARYLSPGPIVVCTGD